MNIKLEKEGIAVQVNKKIGIGLYWRNWKRLTAYFCLFYPKEVIVRRVRIL